MLSLDDVTLLSVTGDESYLGPTIVSILYSQKNIKFGKTKILSNKEFYHPDIECCVIDKMDLTQYSNFMIKELSDFVDTSHVLLVQYDGFVINPEKWTDDFLSFDYIGALWRTDQCFKPDVTEYNRCGNGGFSLRSKRLLETVKKICPATGQPEDAVQCRAYRHLLLNEGIEFGTDDICMKFSIEHTQPEDPSQNIEDHTSLKSFGFHGSWSSAITMLREDDYIKEQISYVYVKDEGVK